MALVPKSGRMEPNTLGIERKIKQKEKGKFIIKMAMFLKVIELMTKLRGLELISIIMEQNMRANE